MLTYILGRREEEEVVRRGAARLDELDRMVLCVAQVTPVALMSVLEPHRHLRLYT
jgi:hypothetical protein